jgi:hypothetical protein
MFRGDVSSCSSTVGVKSARSVTESMCPQSSIGNVQKLAGRMKKKKEKREQRRVAKSTRLGELGSNTKCTFHSAAWGWS